MFFLVTKFIDTYNILVSVHDTFSRIPYTYIYLLWIQNNSSSRTHLNNHKVKNSIFYNSYEILSKYIGLVIHFPRINEACMKFAWLNETFYFPSGNRFTVDIEINDLLTGIRGNG